MNFLLLCAVAYGVLKGLGVDKLFGPKRDDKTEMEIHYLRTKFKPPAQYSNKTRYGTSTGRDGYDYWRAHPLWAYRKLNSLFSFPKTRR